MEGPIGPCFIQHVEKNAVGEQRKASSLASWSPSDLASNKSPETEVSELLTEQLVSLPTTSSAAARRQQSLSPDEYDDETTGGVDSICVSSL